MSSAKKNKNIRSPEASVFYTAGLILLGIVVLAFIISLFWTPYDPEMTDAASKLMAPCIEHPFGTDNFGRDVLSRVMAASKYTIFISAAGVAIALIRGTVSGIPAVYFGQRDNASVEQYHVLPRNTSGTRRRSCFRGVSRKRHMGSGTCFRPHVRESMPCRHNGNKRIGLYNARTRNGCKKYKDHGTPYLT